jgi:hypothetical protein
MVIELEPLTRFTEDQLDDALDTALGHDDSRVICSIVAELERRGQVLEV